MAKKKIKVEFWQKVKYYAEIEVTAEQLQILEDEDGNDVEQYLRKDDGIKSNPAYEILQPYATEGNECDWNDQLEDFEIMSNS